MKKILRLLLQPLLLALYALIALSLVLWWLTPLIGWGTHHPFGGVGARLALVGALFALYVALVLLGALHRRRRNKALVHGLKGASAANRETEVLRQRFDEALKVLEDSLRKRGRRSLLRRGQHLYELPWYVFIGAPGSGKTTALLNAGLNFPLAAKMGQASIKGVGGTRNCDWWFTDDAVLIDTAGRYALQQSDEKVDAAAWAQFLELLKKSRPRRPLNGIVLTVNVQDLLQQAPAERKDHAARLRARVQELHAKLGVRPPVYVLVTKCDLIAGFNETFDSLGQEQRDQVWGFTFPYAPQSREPALRDFPSEFSALEKRLRERLLAQMQAERDPLRRAAIFAFPQQFAGLKGLLGGFLEQVFGGSGALDQGGLLRGVYFTSGTQEGTPIDRVLGTLARTFGVDNRAASVASSRGKSYFLSRLLREVIFSEQGLVGEDRQAESRRRLRRRLGMAAMGLVSLLVLAGWSISYLRNSAYIAEVAARVPKLQAAAKSLPPAQGSDLANLPQLLDQLDAAASSSSFAVAQPPLLATLGLYQGGTLQAGARIGYRDLLEHALLPRVAARLQERLRAANKGNLEYAYDALKAYLMLYEPQHYDPKFLYDWITLDWDQNLRSTLDQQQLAQLAAHLETALKLGPPRAIAVEDKPLVASVRNMLASYPLSYRVLSEIEREGVAGNIPAFTIDGAAGPNAALVFARTSGKPLTSGVPGLYTRKGYFDAFSPAVDRVARQLAAEQSWVLGIAAEGGAPGLLHGDARLDRSVRRLYLEKYIQHWDDLLSDLRLVELGSLHQSLEVARTLAAADSPLLGLLRGISRQTQLAAMAAAQGKHPGLDKLAHAGAAVATRVNPLARMFGGGAPAGAQAGAPVEQMVDDHFASLHQLFGGQPAPIQASLQLFKNAYVQLHAIEVAKRTDSPPPTAGITALRAAAGLQPQPIRSMLDALLDAGANQGSSAQRQNLNSQLKPVAQFCARAIAGRFPFAPGSSTDVLPDDFGHFFGVGGMLDQFFQQNLAAQVDTNSTPWRYKPLPDGTVPPSGPGLIEFERAQRIRQAFFPQGGEKPGFTIDLRMLSMDSGLPSVTLDVDGHKLVFAAGDHQAQQLSWPSPTVASQIQLSGGDAPVQTFNGPWALFRLFDRFQILPGKQPEDFTVVLNLGGMKADLEVLSTSAINPLRMPDLTRFRCPGAL